MPRKKTKSFKRALEPDLRYNNVMVTKMINKIMKDASEGALKGILTYNTEPLVSVDYNHNPASSNFDATLTKVSGRLVKVSSWYDNEWGFSNRMLDTTVALFNAK